MAIRGTPRPTSHKQPSILILGVADSREMHTFRYVMDRLKRSRPVRFHSPKCREVHEQSTLLCRECLHDMFIRWGLRWVRLMECPQHLLASRMLANVHLVGPSGHDPEGCIMECPKRKLWADKYFLPAIPSVCTCRTAGQSTLEHCFFLQAKLARDKLGPLGHEQQAYLSRQR